MKILRDFKNNLLKRREVAVEAENYGNPGLKEAVKIIAEQCKTKEDSITVRTIKSEYGENRFVIEAFCYDSAEAKADIEPKPKVKKALTEAAGVVPAPVSMPVSAPVPAGGKK